MTLFRNKYRVENIRKPNWDYLAPGSYFVTTCTHEMRMYFGTVVNAETKLSTIGECAEKQWREIPNHFKNVTLDEFVVMPNHMHGVIKISGPWEPKLGRNDTKKTLSDVGPGSGSLSHIIRCYKGGVTYWCKEQGFPFAWQAGFHDRIVLGPKSLEAVREYIRDNPANWDKDTENPERQFGGEGKADGKKN
ncbi:MAG TPA: transposase [Candidatus Angelobacter sp.]